MRNRTRVIATAAVAVALAAGSTAAATASPTGGKPGAPAAKTASASKTPPAREAPVPDGGLADLAARLGVPPALLDQALRTVKSSLGTSGTPPTEDQFTAALARVLGIPVARVRQAFPAGTLGGSKKVVKGKEPGGNGPASPAIDAALAAAVAEELHVSTARVNAALRPLFEAGQADPSSPSFAAAARSLGVSIQQLTAALVNAKMSLAKGK